MSLLNDYPLAQNRSQVTAIWDNKIEGQAIRLQLTAVDNQLSYFWMNFTGSLKIWDNIFATKEQKNGYPESQYAFEGFKRRFSRCVRKKPLIIVVTDYQYLKNNEITRMLKELQTNNMSSMHMLFLRSEETEKESANVYEIFSMDDERDIYANKGYELSREDFFKIRNVTNGWPRLVKLVETVLSNQATKEALNDYRKNLLHYLNQDYYTVLSPRLQKVLLYLSLLDRFNVEMVVDITDISHKEFINLIEKNPFFHIDYETGFLKMHHLYRELLMQKNILLTEREKKEFYKHAGDWHRLKDEKLKAIINYNKAGEYKTILSIMKKWHTPQYSKKIAQCYLEVIEQMPDDFKEKNPLVIVIQCHMLSTLYEYDHIYKIMKSFCQKYEQEEKTPEIKYVLGEACIIWANAAHAKRDYYSVELMRKATEYLPEGSKLIGKNVHTYADSTIVDIFSKEKGAFKKNVENVWKGDTYISKVIHGHSRGIGPLAEAEIAYYTRDFKNVEIPLYQSIERALEAEQYDIICNAYFLLMRYGFARGNLNQVQQALQKIKEYADQTDYPDFFSMPDLAVSWYYTKLGRPNKVSDWIRDEVLNSKTVPPRHIGWDRVVRGQYLLAKTSYQEMIPFIDSSLRIADKRGKQLMKIQLWLMRAIAYVNVGCPDKAIEDFQTAYEWTHNNNIIMPFIQYGHALIPVIECCKKSTACIIPASWLNDISIKAKTYGRYQYNIRRQYEESESNDITPIDRLTKREKDTLILLSRGLTRDEIADQLCVSLSTVKGTLRRIYQKINASGRIDAIRIASKFKMDEM